jgi:hypothetical protein
MDFSLSAEQKEMRELALKFARNEMTPHSQEYDEKGIFPSLIFTKVSGENTTNLSLKSNLYLALLFE